MKEYEPYPCDDCGVLLSIHKSNAPKYPKAVNYWLPRSERTGSIMRDLLLLCKECSHLRKVGK